MERWKREKYFYHLFDASILSREHRKVLNNQSIDTFVFFSHLRKKNKRVSVALKNLLPHDYVSLFTGGISFIFVSESFFII